MSLLFFIGMPAAGKTFWGSRVAAKHKYDFIDLDDCIEERELASILEIFTKHEEKGFRAIERATLQKIIKNNSGNALIACGGGTPCYNDNIFLMKEAGSVVYLKADIDILLKNLLIDPNKRPLLLDQADVKGYLEHLLANRASYYELADFTMPIANLSLANFDEIISVCTNRH